MAMETATRVWDVVNRVFVFNPETIQAVKEVASGHYEWSWIVLMVGALLLWNVKCWSFFRDEREKAPQSVTRAVAEGALHWCLSNAALFAAIELHKAVYDHFTEYVASEDNVEKASGIRQAMLGALTKIHLVNRKMTMVPQIRNPQVPFGIMVAFSLVVISLAFLVRKQEAPSESDDSAGDSAEDVQRGYGWN